MLLKSLSAVFRVLVLTFAFTGLAMAMGLFCGLLVVVVGAMLQGQQPDVTLAYRNVAFPLVKAAVVLSFLAAAGVEVRHYLRTRR